jgi:hypothetical protein
MWCGLCGAGVSTADFALPGGKNKNAGGTPAPQKPVFREFNFRGIF